MATEPRQWTSGMLRDFVSGSVEGLRFCGCGQPEAALELVRDVLREIKAYWDAQRASPGFDQAAFARHQGAMGLLVQGKGPQYVVLYALDGAGLTEHGGSVGSCWITERGLAFLDALERYGLDDDAWDDGCDDGWKAWE